jgi:ATP-dependent DNA helicase RecG
MDKKLLSMKSTISFYEQELMDQDATIPFDDRINYDASLRDISPSLVDEYLEDHLIKKDFEGCSLEEICSALNIVRGPEGDVKPTNAGLLFFNSDPFLFYPSAITEMVDFNDDSGTDFSEGHFIGPLHYQLRELLEYLRDNSIKEKIKDGGKARATRFVNFPYQAIEEAVINAYYHRSYEHLSTIELNVHPDKIEILSLPGPLPPLNKKSFKEKRVVSRDYRNRSIGKFLKEMGFASGRGTGIPKMYQAMERNGSPAPVFQVDRERASFLVVLPVHPDF